MGTRKENREMKTRGFVVAIFWVAFAIAPQFVTPSIAAPVPAGSSKSGSYSAQLITRRSGQVFYPGQQIRIQWKDTIGLFLTRLLTQLSRTFPSGVKGSTLKATAPKLPRLLS